VIDRALAGFLEGGVGIHIGARDERLRPAGARAVAVKVDEDGRHLQVYVPAIAAARVLPHLQANGQAAVVFGRPVDDRACQVKGLFAGARPAREDEQPLVHAQWDSFLVQLEQIGYPRQSSAGWSIWPAVAIRLKATALFEQTPGPQAGTPLG
jgi:hypothetical protein